VRGKDRLSRNWSCAQTGLAPSFASPLARPRPAATWNLSAQAFQFTNRDLKFARDAIGLPRILISERAIVPKRAFPLAIKAQPDRIAIITIVSQDGADVVQLVGGGDKARVIVGMLHFGKIVFLPLQPFRLRLNKAIRAAFDDPGNTWPNCLRISRRRGIPPQSSTTS